MAAVLESSPRMAQLESMWTHKERITLIKTLSPWWRDIGLCLEFSPAALDTIYADEAHKMESCCRRLFHCWLGGAGVQPVLWRFLLDALGEAGFRGIADDIERTFTTQYPGTCILLSS